MELINLWKNFNFNKMPYIHAKDSTLLGNGFNNSKDFDDYIENPNFGFEDNKFHLNLLPVPYVGNILKAQIYILMLNPGFGILDYYAESYSKTYRNLLIKNLKQTLQNDKFPFIFLNPELLWHGGGQYWEKKLKDIIVTVAKSLALSYVDSLSFISKRIAVLELVPYHSKSFSLSNKDFNRLYTPSVMLDFVKNYVVPRVQNGQACIISTRNSSRWNLPKNDNIIVYSGGASRAAHMSKNTDGGKKIIEFLLKT